LTWFSESAGVPEHVVQILSGRKTRSVLDRYDIVSSKRTATAIQQLEQARAENGHNFGHNLPESQAAAKQQVN